MNEQAEIIEGSKPTAQELEAAGQGTLLDIEPQPIHAPAIQERAEIAATQAAGIARAAHQDPLTMLASALERGHDPEKLDKLFTLAERYEANEARKAFAAALSDFQADVPPIVESKLATVTMQSGGSYTYSYADLDIIMRAIRPLLGKHGLSVRYDAEVSDDGRRIKSTCYVMHRDGHTETTTFVVPLDEGMKVNDSQKMGSANSYACRYNVINALGLTTGEDDDAGSLHGDPKEKRSSSAAPAKPKPAGDLETLCPIGKHKGQPWDQVPIDYLEWMVANLEDKPDIVERAKRARDDRINSDDQRAQAEAGSTPKMTAADAARGIAAATDPAKLAAFWDTVPESARTATVNFYKTRAAELTGNDKRGADTPDDDVPF